MSCHVWPRHSMLLAMPMATTGLSISAVRSYRYHNFHCMGLLNLLDCANSVWEKCTCLVPYRDSTDDDNTDVDIRLMLS